VWLRNLKSNCVEARWDSILHTKSWNTWEATWDLNLRLSSSSARSDPFPKAAPICYVLITLLLVQAGKRLVFISEFELLSIWMVFQDLNLISECCAYLYWKLSTHLVAYWLRVNKTRFSDAKTKYFLHCFFLLDNACNFYTIFRWKQTLFLSATERVQFCCDFSFFSQKLILVLREFLMGRLRKVLRTSF